MVLDNLFVGSGALSHWMSMGEENFVCTFYRIICLGLTFDPVYFPVYMYFPETAWHLFHKNN